MSVKKCFIICPIGPAGSDTRKRSDQMLNHVYAPVLSTYGFEPVRADKILQSGLITSQIINLILESELVIADLTDGNPNVYYELALRHATRKAFVQVARAHEQIPFDIAGLRTIFVDLTDPDNVEAAKIELHGYIGEFEKGHVADSPIQHARGVRLLQTDPDLAERLLAHVSAISGSGWASLDDIDDKLDDIKRTLDGIEDRLA